MTPVTIKNNKIKSYKLLRVYTLLHCTEHVVLCIPLMLPKNSIAQRNVNLAYLFPTHLAIYIVYVLTYSGIRLSLALPVLQYNLANIYFRKGHPWSRVLNTKFFSLASSNARHIIIVAAVAVRFLINHVRTSGRVHISLEIVSQHATRAHVHSTIFNHSGVAFKVAVDGQFDPFINSFLHTSLHTSAEVEGQQHQG
jgi:hypothetical protein